MSLINFSEVLLRWYQIHKRDLPWRNTKDPYFVWLSEIIMQQTQIKQGLPYYKTFIERFPTILDLSKASLDEIYFLWQGLGYYNRATNLHQTAKYIASERKNVFPSNYKSLLNLKGVGEYTASIMASICFNESRAAVDGNVYRVLSRYFGVEIPINSTKGKKYFKELAYKQLPNRQVGDYNQAIMEFGALHCKYASPQCFDCPLSENCVAKLEQKIKQLPVKLKKTTIKKRYFNYVIYRDLENFTIVRKRKENDIWKNLNEFPLIETIKKVEKNELIKLLKDSKLPFANQNSIEQLTSQTIVHKLTHQHIYTDFWLLEIDRLEEGTHFSKLYKLAFPILVKKFLDNRKPFA